MNKLASIALIFIGILTLNAQDYCISGTVIDSAQIELENNYTPQVNGIMSLNRTITLQFHFVLRQDGGLNFDTNQVDNILDEVNLNFRKIGLSFDPGNYKFISNFNYLVVKAAANEAEIVSENQVDNMLNVYVASNLFNIDNKQCDAYTYYPAAKKDMIFIKSGCLNEQTLTQQLGHFLNLYPTHDSTFGAEPVIDSIGRVTKGDKCYDTPAQPFLLGKVKDCKFTGDQKDYSGDYYIPRTSNFMSAAPVDCKCRFTREQYIRMINAVLQHKSYLW